MPTSPLFDRQVVFMGAVNVTVSTAVISVTPSSIPSGVSGMVVCVNSGNGVNWLSRQDPTATFGLNIPVSGMECIEHEDISDIRFIRSGAADSIITLAFIACRNQPD